MLKFCLLRKDFDFHRNSRPTVPLYADRRELLGFRNFFYSLPACRKGFFRHADEKLSDEESESFSFYLFSFSTRDA